MKCLIQRVKNAKVTVDSKVVGEIGEGMLIFLGNHPHRHRKRSRIFWSIKSPI